MFGAPTTRRTFIACLAGLPGLPLWAQTKPPLLLAQESPSSIDPAGWLVSEKYDGVRAYWDGRTLRFRSGLPIAAPDWFTQRLPPMPLDGELWLDRGRFESLSGIVRRSVPDDAGWRSLRYMLFELPGCAGSFAARVARLQQVERETGWSQLLAVQQLRLPSAQALRQRLEEVLATGGEGLMLHRADAPYHSGRSPALLKLKPLQDADGVVVGHVAGRGRHMGRLGALRLRTDHGIEFLLGTGFSDAERKAPPALGHRVSFTHHGFTADGVPRFASFLRLRSNGD